MRIVFLNIYSGINERGAERSIHELANRLAGKHEVWVVQAGKKAFSDIYYQVKLVPIFFPSAPDSSCSFWRKVYLDLWSLQILFFTLKAIPFLVALNFDVIIPTNGGWQTVLCKLLTFLKRKKMVIVGRAGIGRDDYWNLFWRPDIFVALTSKALYWAKKVASPVKSFYIPNGVNLDLFKPKGEKINLSLKKPIILCVGALTPNKRIDLTIKAISRLRYASLLVLGEGPLKNYLNKLGKKLLGKGKFLLTSSSFIDMPKYYRTANLFTLVSQTGEAFGNVYLEAMACNLAVVATDDASRREIIGKAGLYVNPKNIGEYSQALKKALTYNFADIPRRQASKFSYKVVVKRYEKIFCLLR